MWHFGFKSHLFAAGGVFEGNRFGMKRQTPVPILGFTIFTIAYDRMPLISQMDTYLILPAGQKIYLQQTKLLGLFKHLISSMCQFAFCDIRCGIDDISLVLRQV